MVPDNSMTSTASTSVNFMNLFYSDRDVDFGRIRDSSYTLT